MVASGEQNIGAELMHLEIVWQNPLTLVQAPLRAKWQAIPYYRWAEQPRKIRASRANCDTNHRLGRMSRADC